MTRRQVDCPLDLGGTVMPDDSATPKKQSRIQQRNRKAIMDAALEVFSQNGFRGSTLDQIAVEAGLSKPNILYYFGGKEDIYVTLLNQLIDEWLAPLDAMDPNGDPLKEIKFYIDRKMEMMRSLPRESRLFANEIIQGAPRLKAQLASGVKPRFDRQVALIQSWVDAGKLAQVDARHLVISIWATTQHYADFDAQVEVLMDGDDPQREGAHAFLIHMFMRALKP